MANNYFNELLANTYFNELYNFFNNDSKTLEILEIYDKINKTLPPYIYPGTCGMPGVSEIHCFYYFYYNDSILNKTIFEKI